MNQVSKATTEVPPNNDDSEAKDDTMGKEMTMCASDEGENKRPNLQLIPPSSGKDVFYSILPNQENQMTTGADPTATGKYSHQEPILANQHCHQTQLLTCFSQNWKVKPSGTDTGKLALSPNPTSYMLLTEHDPDLIVNQQCF